MPRSLYVFLLVFVISAGSFGPGLVTASAQPGDADAKPGSKTDTDAAKEQQRERAAIAFARRHHPELAALLVRLRSSDEKAFKKAIRDVSQTRERLLRLEKNDPEQHRQALAVWEIDSQIRLLAARTALSDDPSLDDQLRDLLRKRREARVTLLKLDRERLNSRLERIDQQIERLEDDDEQAIDTELARLKRAVSDSRDGNARDRKTSTRQKPDGATGDKRKPANTPDGDADKR